MPLFLHTLLVTVRKSTIYFSYYFRSIVYNHIQAIVYKRQDFLKVFVHVIIIDQCNQIAEIQVKVNYSRAIWTGTFWTLENSADPDQMLRSAMFALIKGWIKVLSSCSGPHHENMHM